MKTLLKTEELAQLLVCIAALWMHSLPWWGYLLLLLGPDIGMLGYLLGPRAGATTYNLFHHKGLALLIAGIGLGSAYFHVASWITPHVLLMAGTILYGHSCMDRFFGFGLKFNDAFAHTHLGWIGKGTPPA